MSERIEQGTAQTLKGYLEMLATASVIALCAVAVWLGISQRLASAPPVPPVNAAARAPDASLNRTISLAGAATIGERGARVAVIEYSDFHCPFCSRFAETTWPELASEYVKSGRALWAFKHFPLEAAHPHAFRAAEASGCALQQGRFWDMHDRLFASPAAPTDERLLEHAAALKLDVPRFTKCMTGEVASQVRQDIDTGKQLGVAGTPTFFLGTVQDDGLVVVRKRITGAIPAAHFRTVLEAFFKEVEPAKTARNRES